MVALPYPTNPSLTLLRSAAQMLNLKSVYFDHLQDLYYFHVLCYDKIVKMSGCYQPMIHAPRHHDVVCRMWKGTNQGLIIKNQ